MKLHNKIALYTVWAITHSSLVLPSTATDLLMDEKVAPTPAIESVSTAFDETKGRLPVYRNTGYGSLLIADGDTIALYNHKKKHLSLAIYEKGTKQFVIVVPGQEADTIVLERITPLALRNYLLNNPGVRGYPLPKGRALNGGLLSTGIGLALLGILSAMATCASATSHRLNGAVLLVELLTTLAFWGGAGASFAFMKSGRNYNSRDKIFKAALEAIRENNSTSDSSTDADETPDDATEAPKSSLLISENSAQ